MVTIILFLILAYLVDIFLVGISFSAIKKTFNLNISFFLSVFILMLVFAFLDYYLMPIANELNLTFTVGNKEIVSLLNLKENESVSNLFSIEYYDFIIWLVESLIALFVGDKIINRKLSPK